MARFLGNKNTKEVHDKNNENANCQLSEITDRVTFDPDTLAQAKKKGYDPCAWCLPGSTR